MKYFDAVSSLVDECLIEDPIDWGMLPVDEEAAKKTVILGMIEHWETMKDMSPSDREIMMLTIASKLALENFMLHMTLKQ